PSSWSSRTQPWRCRSRSAATCWRPGASLSRARPLRWRAIPKSEERTSARRDAGVRANRISASLGSVPAFATIRTMVTLVGTMMGSKSDWETMSHAAQTLDALAIAYEARVMSAHRTPDLVDEYVRAAEGRGLEVIIAGAGGAAHLAGVAAA